MTASLLRFACVTIILLSGIMLVIHAQPYDDHELRALLMPEGCEMPCFMGIRPGVTTVDEAVKILENSGWVNPIDGAVGELDLNGLWQVESPMRHKNGLKGG